MARDAQPRARTYFSFGVSGAIHAAVLAWVAAGSLAPEHSVSLYDQEILPNQHRIVWYHVGRRVANVSPRSAEPESGPPRARRKFDQTLVAGKKEDPSRSPQMVWNPVPEIARAKLEPLPNLVAVASRPVRAFRAPEARRTGEAAALPEAPATVSTPTTSPEEIVRAKRDPLGNLIAAAPNPVRAFRAPEVRLAGESPVRLPEAPAAARAAATPPAWNTADWMAPLRAFSAPASHPPRAAAPQLPDAPGIASVAGAEAAWSRAAALASPVRAFAGPRVETRARESPSMPDAPAIAPTRLAEIELPNSPPARPLRPFAPALALPPVSHGSAPAVTGISDVPQAELAIVGVDPARAIQIPALPPPRPAEFSAGPHTRPEGASSAVGPATVVVPGLLTRGGTKEEAPAAVGRIAPFTREALIAGMRTVPTASPPASEAIRTASAPDPVLEGRIVYTMAIQMPNITSYIGSWMVWFAERRPEGGDGGIHAPAPLRKVDPKYVASAAAERVEGTVRLSAVIRKDGAVEAVRILKHLDERLDRSASEALAKWLFQPAMRDGAPVEIDAVFEVPFRLAPRPLK